MPAQFNDHFATRLYYDRTFQRDAAKILPGEYYYTAQDMLIMTVLGSCVSACIRDRHTGIGGMNHFMLPDGQLELDSVISPSMRYGTYAMEILINDVLKAGARRENLEAKVFGGGSVLAGYNAINIGERNARFVRAYLKAESIPVIAEDLNDVHARKVFYFPRTGKVLVQKIRPTNHSTLVTSEQDYARRLQNRKIGGDVELFD